MITKNIRRWAPGNGDAKTRKWEGHFPFVQTSRKEVVEVVIPSILTSDLLPTTLELIRSQCGAVRPHFVLIDTGSPQEEQQKVLDLQCDDVEVHLLRAAGFGHASDPVAVALDLALSLCRSEYQVLTHADCFLRRVDALPDLLKRVSAQSPVVGYQISPRPGVEGWQRMCGHTWAALHVPTIRKYGIRWSYGASIDHGSTTGGEAWDTEYGFMRQCWAAGIEPVMLGKEENYERNINKDFDHIRSLPGSRLYRGAHLAKAEAWVAGALDEAQARLNKWRDL